MLNLILKYIEELEEEGKSDKTLIAYITVLRQFMALFEQTNGYTDIDKVTPMDIKDFKQYLVTVLKRKPATVNKALVTLKGFFGWVADKGYIKVDHSKKVKLVEKQPLAPRWLERNEQNRLLRTIEMEGNDFKRTRDKVIVFLMLGAGLRVEEVSNLELEDITVNQRSGVVVVKQGKRSKYREVPLNKDVRESLREYWKEREKHKFNDSNYLFVSERSPKMTTRAIQHLVEEYGVKARIEVLHAHMLRHSFCHNLIVAGEGIEKVAMLAGHSSLESTKVYTVPGERELQIAVENISFIE